MVSAFSRKGLCIGIDSRSESFAALDDKGSMPGTVIWGWCCDCSGDSVKIRPVRRSNHIICLYLACFLFIVILFKSYIQGLAWPGILLQELCQARSVMMGSLERRVCRFLPAGKCNILHAGAVGERRLRVVHHSSS